MAYNQSDTPIYINKIIQQENNGQENNGHIHKNEPNNHNAIIYIEIEQNIHK